MFYKRARTDFHNPDNLTTALLPLRVLTQYGGRGGDLPWHGPRIAWQPPSCEGPFLAKNWTSFKIRCIYRLSQ
eukprot:619621-Lingulodinium_polyedra.AAC.1